MNFIGANQKYTVLLRDSCAQGKTIEKTRGVNQKCITSGRRVWKGGAAKWRRDLQVFSKRLMNILQCLVNIFQNENMFYIPVCVYISHN